MTQFQVRAWGYQAVEATEMQRKTDLEKFSEAMETKIADMQQFHDAHLKDLEESHSTEVQRCRALEQNLSAVQKDLQASTQRSLELHDSVTKLTLETTNLKVQCEHDAQEMKALHERLQKSSYDVASLQDKNLMHDKIAAENKKQFEERLKEYESKSLDLQKEKDSYQAQLEKTKKRFAEALKLSNELQDRIEAQMTKESSDIRESVTSSSRVSPKTVENRRLAPRESSRITLASPRLMASGRTMSTAEVPQTAENMGLKLFRESGSSVGLQSHDRIERVPEARRIAFGETNASLSGEQAEMPKIEEITGIEAFQESSKTRTSVVQRSIDRIEPVRRRIALRKTSGSLSGDPPIGDRRGLKEIQEPKETRTSAAQQRYDRVDTKTSGELVATRIALLETSASLTGKQPQAPQTGTNKGRQAVQGSKETPSVDHRGDDKVASTPCRSVGALSETQVALSGVQPNVAQIADSPGWKTGPTSGTRKVALLETSVSLAGEPPEASQLEDMTGLEAVQESEERTVRELKSTRPSVAPGRDSKETTVAPQFDDSVEPTLGTSRDALQTRQVALSGEQPRVPQAGESTGRNTAPQPHETSLAAQSGHRVETAQSRWNVLKDTKTSLSGKQPAQPQRADTAELTTVDESKETLTSVDPQGDGRLLPTPGRRRIPLRETSVSMSGKPPEVPRIEDRTASKAVQEAKDTRAFPAPQRYDVVEPASTWTRMDLEEAKTSLPCEPPEIGYAADENMGKTEDDSGKEPQISVMTVDSTDRNRSKTRPQPQDAPPTAVSFLNVSATRMPRALSLLRDTVTSDTVSPPLYPRSSRRITIDQHHHNFHGQLISPEYYESYINAKRQAGDLVPELPTFDRPERGRTMKDLVRRSREEIILRALGKAAAPVPADFPRPPVPQSVESIESANPQRQQLDQILEESEIRSSILRIRLANVVTLCRLLSIKMESSLLTI
eukprot:GHVQ01008178.1.p1 GENE.GHVQ01008178.1~~GHVQ01008178.1.p1  ORF type:complete len:958 (+),score=131.31 GHVQ01008178.1:791-3664(+)